MLIVGLVLMLFGFLFAIPLLWTLGIILAVVGAIFWALGSTGRPVYGRRHYW